MWSAIDQPTIRRENASSTAAQYTLPSSVGVLGDVGDPEAVRLGHREVAFDQVRAGCGSRVADRTAAVSPPVEALNACLTHQPGDPFEVDLIAQFHRQLGVHARRTVRPAGLLVDLPDDLEQQLVVLLAG